MFITFILLSTDVVSQMFRSQFQKTSVAVDRFLACVEDNFTSGDRALCMEYAPTMAIKSIERHFTEQMSPSTFQKKTALETYHHR